MSGGKGDIDPSWTLLLLLIAVGAVIWAVWHFFRAELLEFMRWVRLLEFAPFAVFTEQGRSCLGWLWQAPVGVQVVPGDPVVRAAAGCFGIDFLRSLPTPDRLSFINLTPASMGRISTMAGGYWRWLVVLACGALATHAMFFSIRNKFRTKYNLESFIRLQAKMWPVISPVVDFNPTKHSSRIPGQIIPDRLPAFAESLTPQEWISWSRIPVVNGIPDREATRRAFVRQLGPRWNGIDDLPPHLLGLFAAFALKGAQKREESDALLGRLSQAWTLKGGFKMAPELKAEVEKIARDPKIGGEALKIAAKYAWRITALLGVLKWARFMGGVLAPGQFVWLRAEDRASWYPLNNLGRRSFHTEGAGALAHFMAEEAASKPLAMPRVDTAIVTLNQYLAATNADIPPREEPKDKRSASPA